MREPNKAALTGGRRLMIAAAGFLFQFVIIATSQIPRLRALPEPEPEPA